MTVTLNLKPEIEAGLLAQAQATGMSLENYLQQLVEKQLSSDPSVSQTVRGKRNGVGKRPLRLPNRKAPTQGNYILDKIHDFRYS